MTYLSEQKMQEIEKRHEMSHQKQLFRLGLFQNMAKILSAADGPIFTSTSGILQQLTHTSIHTHSENTLTLERRIFPHGLSYLHTRKQQILTRNHNGSENAVE